ncbi:MAG: carboxypeptidase-like regulatory domain-containing protein [Planctomycetes bacterium]|nr:carboxypeptidase-like regulatory domain-containing protein [Planctomycetota bacterium]
MDTGMEVVAAERLPALRLDVPLQVAVAVSLPPTNDPADFDARHRVELQRRRADGAWAGARSGHEPRGAEPLEDTLRGWDEDEGPDVVFRHMAPGVYRAIVDHPGHATAVSPPFELTPGGPAPRITLALAAGRLVRGRVVDLEGRPVAGANLDLVLGDHGISLAGTGEDGTFSLRELPEGLAVVLKVSELFGEFVGNEAVHVEVAADVTWLGDVVVGWSPARGGAGEDDPDRAGDEGR